MPLLKISMNKKANRPPSSAGNGNKFITARDRLIDEESVNKIKTLQLRWGRKFEFWFLE